MSMNAVGENPTPIRVAEQGWHHLKDFTQSAVAYFKPIEESADSVNPQRWGALATDMVDHDKQLEVRMEVPGIDPEALSVSINGRYLVVTGERRSNTKRHEGTVVITERAFGRFQRVIPLSEDVVADKVKARYRDGVLILKLPKSRPSKNGRIDIPIK